MSLRNNPSQTEYSRPPEYPNAELREGQQGRAEVQTGCCMKGNYEDWDSSSLEETTEVPMTEVYTAEKDKENKSN